MQKRIAGPLALRLILGCAAAMPFPEIYKNRGPLIKKAQEEAVRNRHENNCG